jgi:hypothetical protein
MGGCLASPAPCSTGSLGCAALREHYSVAAARLLR